jgi:hypothetical protein
MSRAIVVSLMLLSSSISANAEEYLVKAAGKNCVPGLHKQPAGGPFSVFLFCDDAAGSNIGIVNTSGGAGPGQIALPWPKTWDKWAPNNRFWQDPEWATDITSFAWSPDLRSVYVATAKVYGSGALYRLDLVTRTFEKLVPRTSESHDAERGRSAEITGIDKRTGEVSVSLSTSTSESRNIAVTKYVFK